MLRQTLSSEITEVIALLEELSETDSTNTRLNDKIQEMYDALQQVEGREWDQNIVEYESAQKALKQAIKASNIALTDIKHTSKALNSIASAFETVVKALVFAV